MRRAEEGLSTELGHGAPAPAEPLPWLETLFPSTYTRPLAHFHTEFWSRIWSMRPERSATEFYIWPRGFSKTTNAERAVIALAARGFKYILYVKATQDQANDAVQNIAAVLESPEVERHYPLLSQRQVNKFGHSKGWKRDRIRTASGVIIDAAGSGPGTPDSDHTRCGRPGPGTREHPAAGHKKAHRTAPVGR